MITTRFVLLAVTGLLTISLTACEDSSNTAAKKPARKVYLAHDTQTGSHLQRAYTDPSDATAAGSGSLTGSPDAGQQPFVDGAVKGGGSGAR